MKEAAQWFLWLVVMMVLFVEVNLFGQPVVAKLLIKGEVNPIGDMLDWRIWISFLGGFITLVWWLGRGQLYQSRERFAPKAWRKEFPTHCPVIMRTLAGKDVGPCWYALKDGVCPQHGRIYERRVNHASPL